MQFYLSKANVARLNIAVTVVVLFLIGLSNISNAKEIFYSISMKILFSDMVVRAKVNSIDSKYIFWKNIRVTPIIIYKGHAVDNDIIFDAGNEEFAINQEYYLFLVKSGSDYKLLGVHFGVSRINPNGVVANVVGTYNKYYTEYIPINNFIKELEKESK